MIKIKDLKNKQRFYAMDGYGEAYGFTVFGEPTQIKGQWVVDCTDDGDFCFTFHEGDEAILFLTDSLED